MSPADYARLIGVDFLIVISISIIIGAIAPRCPARWFARDVGPQHLTRWDRPSVYRSLGIPWFARVLPEGGSWLGGESKAALPGRDVDSLQRYLVEVRRGEWVHQLSMIAWIPLVFFNPWWLTLFFVALVGGGNALFLLVLRYNRIRLLRVLERAQG